MPVIPDPDWKTLREKTRWQLISMGCQLWSLESGLVLFPAKWFDLIPEGFVVTSVSGKSVPFSRKTHDSDVRLGGLAYGIVTVR